VASKVVLDASAFLAVANREPGAERVTPVLKQSVMSAVNAAEVLQKLVLKGMSLEKADENLRQLVKEIVAFDHEQAVLVGSLVAKTFPKGLSLGDRACLALGKKLGALVLTTDQVWETLDIGVNVEAIRKSTYGS
jgi:ribonuclease VapC